MVAEDSDTIGPDPVRCTHLMSFASYPQGFVSSNTCRHAQLEDHFTKTHSTVPHPHKPSADLSSCGGMCDNCKHRASTQATRSDLSEAARLILASVQDSNGTRTVTQHADAILAARRQEVCLGAWFDVCGSVESLKQV